MKTKFAKEKSEYSHLIRELLNFNWGGHATPEDLMNKIHVVEEQVKDQGDELVIIVTTRDTNPYKSAPPMTMEDIKNT